MVRIASVGDNFVLPHLLEGALAKHDVTDASFQHTTLPWPQVPFGPVAGVEEASGSEEEVIAAVRGAEVAMTQLAPFTRAVFDSSPDLRMVSVCRGGPVNVDLSAATDAGVVVSFAPGRNAQAAAEFSFGMMLAAMRKIGDGNTALHQGKWRGEFYTYSHAGMELAGNTVGVIGFGAIGRLVTNMVLAFGARVLVFDPYLKNTATVPKDVGVVDLETLMKGSRVVTVHARLSEESVLMLNASTLSLLPRGSVLVNTARGGLLDYAALPALLDSGQLGAVALDVFDEEPPPRSWPLLGRDNVLLTPHLAGATQETAERAASILAADVARFISGQTPEHVANPEVLAQLSLTS